MKFIKQFSIILIISLIGEALHYFIPLPVPASIYGLLIMLAGLQTKLIPLDSVQEASYFLIDIMPLMFIPAAVGLLDSWDCSGRSSSLFWSSPWSPQWWLWSPQGKLRSFL